MKLNQSAITLIAALALSSPLAFADEPAVESCPKKEIAQVYTSSYDIAVSAKEVGKLYQDRVNVVKALEKNKKFKNFKLLDQSLSANPSSYGGGKIDVSVNMSFEYDADFSTFEELQKLLETQTINMNVQSREFCNN